MEEVALQQGLRTWMSSEHAGVRGRASQAEGTAVTKASTKPAVCRML